MYQINLKDKLQRAQEVLQYIHTVVVSFGEFIYLFLLLPLLRFGSNHSHIST